MGEIEIKYTFVRDPFDLDVDLRIPSRGVTALFGPSGSGKTTLLRCIAGLETKGEGFLRIGDEIWQSETVFLPVHRRAVGYVFQEPSLFSHLTVRENLEYGHRRIRSGGRERGLEIEQVVDLLGLQKILERKRCSTLSGGEKQRVAIGRALLSSPRLLLMDEPLSALDSKSKAEIYPYLERLHTEMAIPILYISHSIGEIARLADFLVLIDNGRISVSGEPKTILSRLDLSVSRDPDAGVVIEAVIRGHDENYALTRLDFLDTDLWVGRISRPIGSRVRVRILARDVSIAKSLSSDSSILNILPATITELKQEDGDSVLVKLAPGNGETLLSRITRRSCDQLDLQIGLKVFAQVKTTSLIA